MTQSIDHKNWNRMMLMAMLGLGLLANNAWAEDAAVAEAVQSLADAVTQTTASDGSTASSDEAAADAAAGLPQFESRRERHEYMQNLRETDPEKFKEIMEKRREHWKQNHPDARPRDFRENRFDRREDFRDRREDRWDARHDGGKWDRIEDRKDRQEDIRDRREDRWDAHHGPDRGRPGRHHDHGQRGGHR